MLFRSAILKNVKSVLVQPRNEMAVIVDDGGAQNHLVDVPGQGVAAVFAGNRARLLCAGCSGARRRCATRRGQRDGIAIDIERRLLFGRQWRRGSLLCQSATASQKKKKYG